MWTCNRLDLLTLGSQPFMPKNLPDHCFGFYYPKGVGFTDGRGRREIRAGSHGCQGPRLQVTWGRSVQSQPLRASKLWLTFSHNSWVFGSKYDMDVYMAPLFGGESWNLCWKLGQAKCQTQLSTQSCNDFIWDTQDSTLMLINRVLMVLWVQKLGVCLHVGRLANMSGPWDPMWTNP